MDRETFRKLGHEAIDWIADYLDGVERYPVQSAAAPGETRASLPGSPPESGEPAERLLADFERIIVPGITHWQHPSWFSYFPANSSPPAILGELLSAGLGVQGMLWQTSPAATELEEVVTSWLAQMLGLPASWSGVIQDTASSATLCAIISARERATGMATNERGVGPERLVVYASEEAHSSVEKGVKIAGIGRQGLRRVGTDDELALDPRRLEAAIREDQVSGARPCCVVATVGTTSSTAVDPLGPIADICQRHGLWLHVDAAFAGSAAILPEKRWILDGVERADSFVFNPHKWLLTNFDCSAHFVADPGALVRALEIHPEYLKTGVDAQVKNLRDWGVPLGRRFRALKLWFVIRSYGVEGLRAVLREHLRLADLLASWMAADPRFAILAPSPLSLIAFRLDDGRPEEQLDTLNQRFHRRLGETGLHLTKTRLKGRFALRLVIATRTTEERHVRAAWEILQQVAGEVL